jgi:CRISPR-associated protein Cas1
MSATVENSAEGATKPRVRMTSIATAGELPDSYLLVETYGTFLGRTGERLTLTVKGETVAERSLLGLEHVLVVASGVSLSADAIRACAERGIPISFVSRSGAPYAKLIAPELTGTIQTRRQQLLAFTDTRGVQLVQAFAAGKLTNQASLLKYLVKSRRTTDLALYEMAREAAARVEYCARRITSLTGTTASEIRPAVMNLEAQGARHYWEAVRHLVRLPPGVVWRSRETRGATDLVNQCLNYGYGILYAQMERAVLLAGLDPYAGFLHEDRPGKPSLVLDLVEEFRPYVVDRCIYALLNLRTPLAQGSDGRLDETTRKLIAERIQERLETEEPYANGRRRLQTIIQSQARRVASFVRGEIARYEPWAGRW